MIWLDKNKICVAGNELITHTGEFFRVSVVLHTLQKLIQQDPTRTIEIVFPDCEPITFAGIDHWVDLLLQEIPLTPDRLLLTTHHVEYLNSRITVKYITSEYFLDYAYKHLGVVNWPLCDDYKLFGTIYGRFTMERFRIASHLGINYPDQSIVIFHPNAQTLENNLGQLRDFYKNEFEWYSSYQVPKWAVPPYADYGSVNMAEFADQLQDLYTRYAIDIIGETDCHNPNMFTEKTGRCLLAGKPFLIINGCGALKRLRDMGFKTFSPLIDESYDQEPSITKRVDLIQQEIDRLATVNIGEWLEELKPILIHNQLTYRDNISTYYKQK